MPDIMLWLSAAFFVLILLGGYKFIKNYQKQLHQVSTLCAAILIDKTTYELYRAKVQEWRAQGNAAGSSFNDAIALNEAIIRHAIAHYEIMQVEEIPALMGVMKRIETEQRQHASQG